MIKRADGSYSQRGLWDNIRANRGSGKKPTAQMLQQERKIRKGQDGMQSVDETATMTEAEIAQAVAAWKKDKQPPSKSFKNVTNMYNPENRTDASVVLTPKQKNQYYLEGRRFDNTMYNYENKMLNNTLNEYSGNNYIDPEQEMLKKIERADEITALGKKLKNTAKLQMGGMPQTSLGQSVLQEAMMNKMQEGGKMPSDIARARFMAAAKGNVSQAKETASKYGYKMQAGGYKPSFRIGDRGNYSGSDNTMVANNPAVMQQRIAEGQALQKKVSTEQGRIQMQQAKQRAQSNIAANRVKQEQKVAAAKAQQLADMKARIEDSNAVQDMSLSDQFKPENIERATQATGDKLRAFGPSSPLVTSGLFEADPNSFFDSYLNPAKFVGDMATNLGQGINESYQTGEIAPVAKALATPVIAGVTMKSLEGPIHSLQHKIGNTLNKNVNSAAFGTALTNPNLATSVGVGAGLLNQGVRGSLWATGKAAEHDLVHRTIAPTVIAGHKNGGTIKDMYYMKNGGQFPDRYKKMGFKGVDQPKRTTSGGKSHAVVTKVGDSYKLIRFGQAGVTGSPDGSARNKAFKARHAKNIAKGKSSAAYWANKVKW